MHLTAVRDQREKHPHSKPYTITEKMVNLFNDDFQAIREQGDRIDYDTFSEAALQIDELLKKLRTPVQYRRTDILNDLSAILDNIEQKIKDKK